MFKKIMSAMSAVSEVSREVRNAERVDGLSVAVLDACALAHAPKYERVSTSGNWKWMPLTQTHRGALAQMLRVIGVGNETYFRDDALAKKIEVQVMMDPDSVTIVQKKRTQLHGGMVSYNLLADSVNLEKCVYDATYLAIKLHGDLSGPFVREMGKRLSALGDAIKRHDAEETANKAKTTPGNPSLPSAEEVQQTLEKLSKLNQQTLEKLCKPSAQKSDAPVKLTDKSVEKPKANETNRHDDEDDDLEW